MKVIFIITLFALSLCDIGFEKRCLNDDDKKINDTFLKAFELYSTNINQKIDFIIRLTVYTQVVSGTNYRITFIDSNAEYPTIHEYQFYNKLPVNNNGKDELELTYHNEYDGTEGLLAFNSDEFTIVEKKLYNCLKKQKEKLYYIIYAYPVESQNYRFYIVNADTENGIGLFVIGQDMKSQEFDLFHKIK